MEIDVKNKLPLQGEKVNLTALYKEDLPELKLFFADIAVLQYYLPTTVRPYNLSQLEKLMQEWNDGVTCFVFAIRADNKLIGIINLDDLDWSNSNAEVGIAITDRDVKGKGYASDALQTLSDYAFKELGLHRLWARIIEDNEASINLFKKAGFVSEGKMIQHVRRNGVWKDMTVWGLIVNNEND